eukprot:Lankesteria_metandrocarpae@DN4682_c1_g1_i2.p1
MKSTQRKDVVKVRWSRPNRRIAGSLIGFMFFKIFGTWWCCALTTFKYLDIWLAAPAAFIRISAGLFYVSCFGECYSLLVPKVMERLCHQYIKKVDGLSLNELNAFACRLESTTAYTFQAGCAFITILRDVSAVTAVCYLVGTIFVFSAACVLSLWTKRHVKDARKLILGLTLCGSLFDVVGYLIYYLGISANALGVQTSILPLSLGGHRQSMGDMGPGVYAISFFTIVGLGIPAMGWLSLPRAEWDEQWAEDLANIRGRSVESIHSSDSSSTEDEGESYYSGSSDFQSCTVSNGRGVLSEVYGPQYSSTARYTTH